VSIVEAVVRSVVAVAKSSAASSRSSASAVGSRRSPCSSVNDSDAFSHCCSAVVIGRRSPNRLAAVVSKEVASWASMEACSRAAARARDRSVEESVSRVAATGEMRICLIGGLLSYEYLY